MRLLIVTQKVDKNDSVLGFFHRWLEEFAKHCERLTVICLEKGTVALPSHVTVYSLGKEHMSPRRTMIYHSAVRKMLFLVRFLRYIIRLRKEYDAVFVHMNHEYILLGAFWWKILRRRIGLWYAHGHVSFGLRVAERLVDIIFTSTSSGFRIRSRKVRVVGQGIDTRHFSTHKRVSGSVFHLLSVGRVSPVKRYEIFIGVVEELEKRGISCELCIVGPVAAADERYFRHLKELIAGRTLNYKVRFAGAVPYSAVREYFFAADCFVSASETGSLDKALLEAMATGLPTVASSEALQETIGELASAVVYSAGDARALVSKLLKIYGMNDGERYRLGVQLRDVVVSQHGIERLITRALSLY